MRSIYLLPLVLLFYACSADNSESYECIPCDDIAAQADNAFSSTTITGTRWLYQLQDADPSEISLTGFDTVVMDYSSDGSDSGKYTPAEINDIKISGIQAIAYLSIGEAENYRYYFNNSWISGTQPGDNAPCWLNRTNPEWEGNYKVQYWSEAWQQIILGYLDKIIDQGFDGVYLDIIDGFEYWSSSSNGEGYYISEEEAALRMINFVKRIAYHARVTRGRNGFLIIPQNGENILDFDSGISYLGADDYINTISGIGIEDLYYDEIHPIPGAETDYRLPYINQIKSAGKKVLVVDYLDTGTHAEPVPSWRTAVTTAGFYPYAAIRDRELNEINTFTGQPD